VAMNRADALAAPAANILVEDHRFPLPGRSHGRRPPSLKTIGSLCP
jgi:hypothetical protein